MGIYTSMQLPFLKKSFVDMSQKLLKRKYDIFPSFNAQFFLFLDPALNILPYALAQYCL